MIIDYYRFIQPDLEVVYMKRTGTGKYKFSPTESNYHIYIFLGGHNEIYYKDQVYIAKNGDVLIMNNSEKCVVEHFGKPSEAIYISFNPKIFCDIDQELNIVKPFSFSKRMRIYNDSLYNTSFDTARRDLYTALVRHSSRAFVFSAVFQMLCSIYYAYQDHTGEPVTDEQNNFVRIASYIDEHIHEPITLQDVADNVFLSKRCIQNQIKKSSRMTFRELVRSKRMSGIKKLIKGTDIPMEQIAKTVGYRSYVSFFRDFKIVYGVSPVEARNNPKIKM